MAGARIITPHRSLRLDLPHVDHWRLLTPMNIHLRQLWGWGYSIQKILGASEPRPLATSRLLIASDYGGDHHAASHRIYCYLVVRGGGGDWLSAVQSARRSALRDGRKMSYKRLNDHFRQRALVPFLKAAANLDGHLVAIAVDKQKKWLSVPPNVAQDLSKAFGLKATWNPKSLEAMMRKVHFLSILVSIWSRPYSDVTWVTDEDEFVANDTRHDDALLLAGRISSLYLPHPMRIFRLNTTGQDPDGNNFEDLCAVPDLAAGMLSEIATRLAKEGKWENRTSKIVESDLPTKAEVISDWFWDTEMRLRKTFISIDVEGKQFSVRRVSQLQSVLF
jgi:hypothetical protein